MSTFRTDINNNPTAFTTNIAAQAGLKLGVDYVVGTPFTINGTVYHTAKLLGLRIAITARVITAIGFYTKAGAQRWSYISMPMFVWNALTNDQKRDVIGFMYQREGGTDMRSMFPNFGKS